MHYTVYQTTNLVNGKIYIGVHAATNIYDNYLGSGEILHAAIQKYGRENFKKQILYVFIERAEAYAKEKEIVNIAFVKRNDTYNLATGGSGNTIYDAKRKAKLSESMRGINHPSYGRKCSEESNIKRSKAMTGKKMPLGHKEKCIIAQNKKINDPTYMKTLTDSQNRPNVVAKKSKSMKDYASTEAGKANLSKATKDTTFMNDGVNNKRVKSEDIDTMTNLGWQKGILRILSEETKRKMADSKRGMSWFFDEINQVNKKISPDDFQYYLDNGWKKGFRSFSKK